MKVIAKQYPPAKKVKLIFTREKPPRFKVGDEVKLIWNQRSKYRCFCRKCGKGLLALDSVQSCEHFFPFDPTEKVKLNINNIDKYTFYKTLGTGVITEVFKIKIGKIDLPAIPEHYYIYFGDWITSKLEKRWGSKVDEGRDEIIYNGCGVCGYPKLTDTCPVCSNHIDGKFERKLRYYEALAKDDGVEGADQMFAYLDKAYDLSESRPFYVDRWDWK